MAVTQLSLNKSLYVIVVEFPSSMKAYRNLKDESSVDDFVQAAKLGRVLHIQEPAWNDSLYSLSIHTKGLGANS